MERKTHTIDASGKSLGRLASQIALLLRGKDRPDFVPHKDEGGFVAVKNASEMKISGKKINQKKYYSHSGHLGGLKEMPMKKLFERSPGEVLKRAVFGMLPKNKLRAIMIKRLKFE